VFALKISLYWASWYTSVIPAVKRLMQKDRECKASLGYIDTPCPKKKKKKKKINLLVVHVIIHQNHPRDNICWLKLRNW
jgi:hypothetical protein